MALLRDGATTSAPKEAMSRDMAVVLLVCFLYGGTFMMVASVLPYLVTQVGGGDSKMSYGTMQSAFSSLQLLGGLAAGVVLFVVFRWELKEEIG